MYSVERALEICVKPKSFCKIMNCPEDDCYVCIENNMNTYNKELQNMRTFKYRFSCVALQKVLGYTGCDDGNLECETCPDIAKKYIEEDFKEIFNGFKTEKE